MAAFVSCPFMPPSNWARVTRLPQERSCRHCDAYGVRMEISPRLVKFSGAAEFEIRQFVGSLGFKTITDWEYYSKEVSPLAPTRTVESGGPQIRLYDARCLSRNPRLFNARVLLKEFLYPDGVELGVAEAETYKQLYQYRGSTRLDPDEIPIATLIGSFLADDSFKNTAFIEGWKKRFPRSPEAPKAGSPWLVFRWEGTLTAQRFPTRPSTVPLAGSFWTRLLPKMADRRREYLVVLMLKSLLALKFLHSAGIVHRSVSSSSLMVNTIDEGMFSSLEVKLRDFGFAKSIAALVSDADELQKAKKAGAVAPGEIARYFCAEDIYMLGYAFCELVFGTLTDSDKGSLPDYNQDRFKSLFEDTFSLSVDSFREYCLAEPVWEPAVAFLDAPRMARNDATEVKYSGWDLLRSMLGARENFKTLSVDYLLDADFFTSS